MKSSALLFLFSFTFLFSACSDSSKSESQKSLHTKEKTKLDAPEMVDKELPTNFYKRFTGTIGQYPITLEFIKTDSVISGSYYYNNIKSPLVIKGKYVSVTQIEYDEYINSTATGSFSGKLISESTFTGTWSDKQSNKTLDFNLKAVETEISKIKQLNTHKEKCHHADETRNEFEGTVNEAETACSSIDLSQIELTTKNPEIGKKINATLTEVICESYGEASNSLKEWFGMLNSTDFESEFTLEVDCSVKSIYKNIISIEVSSYSYSQGAAHPNSYTEYVNFNLKTGERIEYEDLLQPTAMHTFSQATENKFVEIYNNDSSWDYESGNFPLSRNFVLQSDGIFFLYNPYEIGSYAQGYQSFLVPYKNIRSLIKPDWINIFHL